MNNGKLFKITNGNENNKYIRLVANQKVLKLVKYTDSIDYTAHNKARRELTANAFVLYDYLLCHSNNWIWALSSSDVIAETPLKMSTYNKAVQELIEMHYMIPHEIDIGSEILTKDAFYFFETPPINNSDILPKYIPSSKTDDIDAFEECEEEPVVTIKSAKDIKRVMPWENPQAAITKPVRYY